jgi:hypothetical protein
MKCSIYSLDESTKKIGYLLAVNRYLDHIRMQKLKNAFGTSVYSKVGCSSLFPTVF